MKRQKRDRLERAWLGGWREAMADRVVMA
ncbi:MAG: hypothetical protein E7B30_04185 [Escherichia coli]|nr:hypothetical protein [Escherichia coli]